jgi:hypothetical protein
LPPRSPRRGRARRDAARQSRLGGDRRGRGRRPSTSPRRSS